MPVSYNRATSVFLVLYGLNCEGAIILSGEHYRSMLGVLKPCVKTILNLYPRWICRQEFEQQSLSRFNERPVEFSFVFRQIARIYPVKVLDVGTGTTALPHLIRNCGLHVTAIDNVKDYWPTGMLNRHYHVIDDDINATKLNETFDLITCVSVLEHIKHHDAAVHNMLKHLNPKGCLVVTCPYTESNYIRNVYELPGSSYGQDAPYIAQSYSRKELNKWCSDPLKSSHP